MDEILEKFDNTLKAGKEDESFKSLYKNWGKFGNQEQRRSEILKQQKNDRRQKLDNCRGILSLIQSAQERDGIFSRSCELPSLPATLLATLDSGLTLQWESPGPYTTTLLQYGIMEMHFSGQLLSDIIKPPKEPPPRFYDLSEKSTSHEWYELRWYRPKVYVPGFARKSYYLDNILMHSEWMIEKPEDFSTNWYVTPCPIGVRMLVVAGNGVTKCYTKYGQFRFEVQTLLPGGNYQEKKKNCSVLDCFYYSDTNTMYVLDILSWNNHIMADGEMEFRHFWLQTKFSENPGLDRVTKRNRLSFQLLPMVPCDKESLEKFMNAYPPFTSAKLDGLLFYHKQAHYVPGVTPLVGWLFPFMVPEVLGSDISIHELYAAEKPNDYVDQATYIQKFEEKMSKKIPFTRSRKSRRQSSNSQSSSTETTMESEEIPVENTGSVEKTTSMDAETATGTAENGASQVPSMDAETSTGTAKNRASQKMTEEMQEQKAETTTMDSEECKTVEHVSEIEDEVIKSACAQINNDTKEDTASMEAEAQAQAEQNGANQVPPFFINYYGTSIFSSPNDNEQPPITSFYSLF